MKILTISIMKSYPGSEEKKPTVFAEVVKDGYLKSTLRKGLHEKCGVSSDELECYLDCAEDDEGVIGLLNKQGFAWWDADTLIELTDVGGAA